MANHKQAKKRILQNAKRQARNRHHKSTMRTFIKKVRAAVEAGEKDTAQAALAHATKIIDQCAARGVIHKGQASRRVSRLSALVASAAK